MKNKIEEITEMARSLFPDEFNRLRMEEELLVALVRHQGYNNGVKKLAFKRMRQINLAQMENNGYMFDEINKRTKVTGLSHK